METANRFVANEVSGIIASEKNHSTDVENLVIGGADAEPNENGDKVSENVTNRVQNQVVEQSLNSIQDIRASNSLVGRSKENKSAGNLFGKDDSLKQRSLDDGQICFCTPHATMSTGEKKLDETMDYAIKNLSEASKALTNLGDNFEHDLKLMFMDIMTRVQHWVCVVQNRLQAAKTDLESIRKESISRVSDSSAKDLELVELRTKLRDAEAKLTALEKRTPHAVRNSTESTQARQESVTASVQAVTPKDRVEDRDKLQNGSAVVSVNAGYQCGQDRERIDDREAELEAEISQLLEENERMMKERAEYEHAIHCALVRGVSSLNVETLRVLRCPPIPCCNPCGLLTPRSDSPESVVLCRQRSTRCDSTPQPVQRGSKSPSKHTRNNKIGNKNDQQNLNNCCQSLSEHLLYCGGSNEQSSVFFLPHGDSGNQCKPCAQPRYRPGGTSITRGTVCVGGKCKKTAAASAKEKISSGTRSPVSRPAPYDVCVRDRDDSEENDRSKRSTALPAAKRCGGCVIRNRRTKED